MKSLSNRMDETLQTNEKLYDGTITMKDETARRNMFEVGTPVNYFDGKKDIAGNVVMKKNGHQAISPYDSKNKSVTQDFSIIPQTWFNVRKFKSSEKKYTETFKDDKTMHDFMDDLIIKKAAFYQDGKKLTYWL